MIGHKYHCNLNFFITNIYAVNKQLNDKERVAAALENPNLLDMVDECLAPSYYWTSFSLQRVNETVDSFLLMVEVGQFYLYV